jgi:DNA-binding transcriptional MerR regulator
MSTEKTTEDLTIGKLIKELKQSYPDVSSSKLRFLESQGLVKPKRGLNKYRVYTKEDIKKIDLILKMQKDFYLPLEVIKKKLDSTQYQDYLKDDNNMENLQLDLGDDTEKNEKNGFIPVEEAKKRLKVTRDLLDDLLEHELIEYRKHDGKVMINSADTDIIRMARELSRYGIQVKHLKMFENFAIRHASFIQQITMPLMISSKNELRRKGKKAALKLEKELCRLHEILLKKENRKFLENSK